MTASHRSGEHRHDLVRMLSDTAPVVIRDARPEDWDSIWPFFRLIVAAGETYAYHRDMDYSAGCGVWMVTAPGRTIVATDDDGTVVGTANMYANRGGPGSHVASASFMVDPRHAGHGTGRLLGEHVLDWARENGYRAIQFNAVVETNERAIALWRSLGFKVLANVPEAFDHPSRGYVGLLMMYRLL
ncbi:MAG TPA: GNAT family N-acetyltransferase [Solirubrobacteraceae bacterium]